MELSRYPLGALLARAHARYVADCETRLAAAGFPDLTIAHGSNVLRHLVPGGTTRIAEIVRASGVSKQAISQQVSYLAARGYLTVEPDDRDARAKSVRLTARGEESQRAVRGIFAEVESAWRARHGDARLRTVHEVLAEVARYDAAP